MREVTEKDCAIFVGQAYAFAARIAGDVVYQSAMYADIKASNGAIHSLIGPGNAGDGYDWIAGNRKYIREVLRR